MFILGVLGPAAFYEDETRYGVCPYANQRGNLSFIVCAKSSVLFCNRLKAYGVCRALKNIMSDGMHLLLLTLNYTIVLPG